jgi:hypothetical protein
MQRRTTLGVLDTNIQPLGSNHPTATTNYKARPSAIPQPNNSKIPRPSISVRQDGGALRNSTAVAAPFRVGPTTVNHGVLPTQRPLDKRASLISRPAVPIRPSLAGRPSTIGRHSMAPARPSTVGRLSMAPGRQSMVPGLQQR